MALNVMHESDLVVATRRGGELDLIDSPTSLGMVATLPAGDAYDDVLAMVGDGLTGGLSVEFNALLEDRTDRQRTIRRATLPALGIVDRPGLSGQPPSRFAPRAAPCAGAIVPGWQRNLACKCQSKDCNAVRFDAGAFTDTLADPDREILAVMGNYDRPLASRRRGTLRIEQTADGVSIELDLPDGPGGAAVEDAAQVAPLYARPYLDATLSEYIDEGDTPGEKVRRFIKAHLRAVIVGATDATDGLTEAVIGAAARPRRPRRRRRIWL